MRERRIAETIFLTLALIAVSMALSAQETQVMMPEESEAKARQILQQAIQALGGSAYLNVHDVTCTGRLGQFEHSGNLSGYEKFIDYEILPDKERQENLPKRNLIEVYNGDHGWILDRGGVTEAPEDAIAEFKDGQRKDLDNVLRHRLNEKGMLIRYAGEDIVDLLPADWIELVDSEDRTIRIAVSRSTHLPVRKVTITRDPNSRLRMEETEFYSNYHPLQGIMTPFQIERQRNGQRVYQVFFSECKYNTNPSSALFTKESLDQRWSEVGKKAKKQ